MYPELKSWVGTELFWVGTSGGQKFALARGLTLTVLVSVSFHGKCGFTDNLRLELNLNLSVTAFIHHAG